MRGSGSRAPAGKFQSSVVFLDDLPSVTGPDLRLFLRNNRAADILWEGLEQQVCAEFTEFVMKTLSVISWRNFEALLGQDVARVQHLRPSA